MEPQESMEPSAPQEEPIITKCPNCCATLEDGSKFCHECGFPARGDDKEQKQYYHRKKLKYDVWQEANKKVRRARNLILVIAGLNFIAGLIYLLATELMADAVGMLIAAVVYLGCAIWATRQPLMGFLAALSLFIIIWVVSAIVDPSYIYRGIILKIIFLVIFIRGISSARDAKNYEKQLKEMKAL